jgi:hypothetical protein
MEKVINRAQVILVSSALFKIQKAVAAQRIRLDFVNLALELRGKKRRAD